MQTKYAVMQNIPDGSNEVVKLFPTEEEAQAYADNVNFWLLDDDEYFLYVEEVNTMTVPYGQTVTF